VTLHPVLPMRAVLVAAGASALGLLALANLSPTPELSHATVVHEPSFSIPIPARVVYSPARRLILSRADSPAGPDGAQAVSRRITSQ
jgi:hypothetical protein